MRIVAIGKWDPAKWPELAQRFHDFVKGTNEEVLEACKRVNEITWELGSALGMNKSVWVAEGEPRDISTLLRYWMDLIEFDVFPTFDFEVVKTFYPDRHPYFQD